MPGSPRRSATASPLLGGYGRGVAWTYLSVVATGASTFFLAGWTIRRVGPGEYGQFAVVLSLAGLLAIVDYAMGLAVQRSSARIESHRDPGDPDRVGERDAVHAAHAAYAALGLLAAGLTGLAFVGVQLAAPARMPRLAAVVALLGLATALQVATAALPAVAAGSRRFSVRTMATLAGVGVRVAVAVLAVGRWGVAGLALAHLVGMAADRLVLVELLRRRVEWFVARPGPPDRPALRAVVAYAVPLLVLNVSGQLLAVSDLVVVGALVGASAAGLYQLATLLPLQVAGFLMVGYNVAFPSLAGTDDATGQEDATAFLTRSFAFVGGTALALAAFLRTDVVHVLLGRPSGLAGTVLVVFCAVSLANLVLHGLTSVLIARGDQAVMARVVAIELPVNLVLTVALVVAFGAAGAAAATLATVVLMDFVVFPVVTRHRFARPALDTVARHGLLPAATGAVLAGAAAALATALVGPGAPRLALGALVAGALAGGAGLVLLGTSGRRTLRHALAPAVAS